MKVEMKFVSRSMTRRGGANTADCGPVGMDGLMALPRGRPRHLALLITVVVTGLCSHTVEGQPYFEIISSVPTGACTLSQNGTCFTDGPGQYAANERCAIRVLTDVVITVHEFVSEYGECILRDRRCCMPRVIIAVFQICTVGPGHT
jgi:hypothetical protein